MLAPTVVRPRLPNHSESSPSEQVLILASLHSTFILERDEFVIIFASIILQVQPEDDTLWITENDFDVRILDSSEWSRKLCIGLKVANSFF